MAITSRTRTLAVIGDPIEHSLTPLLQNAAWQAAGQDVVNIALHIPAAQLTPAVQGARAMGLLGLMVTIPHKEAVLELCDQLDASARAMGAANLLHFVDRQHTVGYSTDGWSALRSLAEAGQEVHDKSIVLLGAGGASRSLALTLAGAGVRSLLILNRNEERARVLAAEVARHNVDVETGPLNEAALERGLSECDLLINGTSVGMHPRENDTPVPAHLLRPDLTVYDIVYRPHETCLLREARCAGARGVDGLGMLIYTNVRAAQICAGCDLDVGVMRRAALQVLEA